MNDKANEKVAGPDRSPAVDAAGAKQVKEDPAKGRRRHQLGVRDLVKKFGSLRANDGIDLTFEPGEVHGLLGENGAGKSTLVKILAGIYQPDGGWIELSGERIRIDSPLAARARGIAVLHQHSTLVPALTVRENVSLVEGGLGRLDPSLGERLARTAAKLGFELDPRARVADLSVGQRQRVEIARALMHEASFILLDEPTPVLAPGECEELFRLLHRIAASGTGVVLVTHRLEEAQTECDQVTVMRRGRVAGTSAIPRELSERELINMLVGEGGVRRISKGGRTRGEVLVGAHNLRGAPPHGRLLRGLDLSVHAGEVLGIAGVEGNGQRELAAALTGSWQPDGGTVTLRGIPLADYGPGELTSLVGDIPDDEELAVALDMSVWENLALRDFLWERSPHLRNRTRAKTRAARIVDEFEIKTTSVDTPLRQLSGGNRRRVMLARELSKEPLLLVASYPIKGLDVRASRQVKEWIWRATASGSAVVYMASELEELIDVSDRIAVMARGRVTGVVAADGAEIGELGRLMLADVGAEDGTA